MASPDIHNDHEMIQTAIISMHIIFLELAKLVFANQHRISDASV
jgi:hypothetical protein